MSAPQNSLCADPFGLVDEEVLHSSHKRQRIEVTPNDDLINYSSFGFDGSQTPASHPPFPLSGHYEQFILDTASDTADMPHLPRHEDGTMDLEADSSINPVVATNNSQPNQIEPVATILLQFRSQKVKRTFVEQWLREGWGERASDQTVAFKVECAVCKPEAISVEHFDGKRFIKARQQRGPLFIRAKAIADHWNTVANHRRKFPAFQASLSDIDRPLSPQDPSEKAVASSSSGFSSSNYKTRDRTLTRGMVQVLRDDLQMFSMRLRQSNEELSQEVALQSLVLPCSLITDGNELNEQRIRQVCVYELGDAISQVIMLTVHWTPVDTAALLDLFPNLKTITLSIHQGDTDVPTLKLTRFTEAVRRYSWRTLKHLVCIGVPQLDTVFHHLSRRCEDDSPTAQLKSIIVHPQGVPVSEAAVQALSRLPALKTLRFHISPNVRMDSARDQGAFPKLKSLSLHIHPPCSPKLFRSIQHLSHLVSCCLVIHDGEVAPFSDESFKNCMMALKNLERLRLDGFLLDPHNYNNIGQLPGLRFFVLQCCPHLYTSELSFLSQLPLLEHLTIEDCDKVVLDEVLMSTLAHCPRLRYLECDIEVEYDTEDAEFFRLQLTPEGWKRLQKVHFEIDGQDQQLRHLEEDKYELCPRPEVQQAVASHSSLPAQPMAAASAASASMTAVAAPAASTVARASPAAFSSVATPDLYS
jgi:hypothetical protein